MFLDPKQSEKLVYIDVFLKSVSKNSSRKSAPTFMPVTCPTILS